MMNVDTLFLVIGLFFLLCSFFSKRNIVTVLLLFTGSFFVGYFFALLDSFLGLWDEQFHALVAKNMVSNPFKPMLYNNPILVYDYKDWSGNYVWLHKQPLFLWQIALSIKLFGCTELAVRLPSIIMHAILSAVVFRMGNILFNRRVGLMAAILFSVAKYSLELVSGKYGTDHNDVAFMFYISLSIWALTEYVETKNNKWIYLIGLFSGCAVLVKWVVGLVVYLCWVTYTFFTLKSSIRKKEIISVVKALVITMLVALPWQIYTLYYFPLESKYELQFNARHFFISLEGHEGGLLYYWNVLYKYFGDGDLVAYLILISIVFSLYKLRDNRMKIIGITFLLSVFIFYTIAATKMTSYFSICIPFIFVLIAASIQAIVSFFYSKIKNYVFEQALYVITVVGISFMLLNYNKVVREHSIQKTHDGTDRRLDLLSKKVTEDCIKILGDEKYVVFNVTITPFQHIPFMFYTDYVAYGKIPTEEECKAVESKGYKIAIIDKGIILPDYIKNNPAISKIYVLMPTLLQSR